MNLQAKDILNNLIDYLNHKDHDGLIHIHELIVYIKNELTELNKEKTINKITIEQMLKELINSPSILVHEDYLMKLDVYDKLEVIISNESISAFLLDNNNSNLYTKSYIVLILNELLYI